MKKVIMLVLSLTLAMATFSQVMKYRAFQTRLDQGEWHDRNILVVVNVDRDRIHVYGEKEIDLSILYEKNVIEKDDGKAFFYSAVDQDGIHCEVMFKNFNLDGNNDPDENVAALTIIYSNLSLVYRLKKD